MTDYFKYFMLEAELFFVTKFVASEKIVEEYTFCLDVIYNVEKKQDVDYGRGIISINPLYGQGKSFFFEVLHHMHRRLFAKNIFKKTSAKDLAKIFKDGGESALLDFIKVRNIFIDDIGDEAVGDDKTFSHYNDKLNVLRYVLLKRYEFWVSSGGKFKTYGTTNLDIKTIAKVYDGRVADRLVQMCYLRNFDFFEADKATGKKGSFRQMKTTRPLTIDEIKANWARVRQPSVKANDEFEWLKYMNSLLLDTDEYIENIGEVTFNVIKRWMLINNYLIAEDFASVTEDNIDAAYTLAKKQARESVSVLMRNALPIAKTNKLNEKLGNITREDAISIAENVVVRKKLLSLKATPGFKFV